MEDDTSALELALADVEILRSAYPDETSLTEHVTEDGAMPSSFPLHLWLHLSDTAFLQLEWNEGYPITTNIEIVRYRCKRPEDHVRLEHAVEAVRITAETCRVDGVEGGLACCAAALDAFATCKSTALVECQVPDPESSLPIPTTDMVFAWITGEPLHDRKSTFIAHLCRIQQESHVKPALAQLLSSHSKYQRATHNMYAYRISEQRPMRHGITPTNSVIWKHDNDDDGEDGAGKRLAHLLELRHENGVLIVVSRWFGGIHLGPKRFAHIVSTAQALLASSP